MKLAIIADDFTGSNDTGVQFAKKKLKTVVTTCVTEITDDIKNSDIVVFDTESRFDNKETAYNKNRIISNIIKDNGCKLIYKKLDSTFRGNIGAEIDGCMMGIGCDFAILIPALPSNGRQTINGNVIVNGQLLSDTEIANDPKTPVNHSYIPHILKEQCDRKTAVISKVNDNIDVDVVLNQLKELKKSGTEIVIIDAETDEDLLGLAKAVSLFDDGTLIVGTAGLAEFITDAYNLYVHKPILSIVGSVSNVTRAQINYTKGRKNLCIIDLSIEDLFDSERKDKKKLIISRELKSGKDVVVRTAKDKKDVEDAIEFMKNKGFDKFQTSEFIACGLGELTGNIINEFEDLLGAIYITGGDTLIKIANYLEISGMIILEEVLPAIPMCRFVHPKFDKINVVTKAGAFGSDDTFSRILDYMR
ncbi:MAG: hypothetical protein CVV00_10740 [Firmicutes bacterium HGW-Firmicutes-5]|nr:MAG: hypothetical protein CVV00_10740 [Firmicutes bacterium HGW-Firmicutes-5]